MHNIDDIFKEEVESLKTEEPIVVKKMEKWRHTISCFGCKNVLGGTHFIERHLAAMPWLVFRRVPLSYGFVITPKEEHDAEGRVIKVYVVDKDPNYEDDGMVHISDRIDFVFSFVSRPTYMQWVGLFKAMDMFHKRFSQSYTIDGSTQFITTKVEDVNNAIYREMIQENVPVIFAKNDYVAHVNREISICGYDKSAYNMVVRNAFPKCKWNRSKEIFKNVSFDKDPRTYDMMTWKFELNDLRLTKQKNAYDKIFDSYEKHNKEPKVENMLVLDSEFIDSEQYTGFVLQAESKSPGERIWLTYLTPKSGAWNSRLYSVLQSMFQDNIGTIRVKLHSWREQLKAKEK